MIYDIYQRPLPIFRQEMVLLLKKISSPKDYIVVPIGGIHIPVLCTLDRHGTERPTSTGI